MTGSELKKLVDDSGLTNKEIVEKSGIPQRTLYNLYDKEIVEKHRLIELCKALPIIAKLEKLSIEELKSNNTGIPVYNVDFTAGDITQFADFQEKVIGYIDMNGFRKCIAFVKIKGNSMFPTFTAGDLVGLEPMEDISIIEYGQPFAIVTKSGQSLIKIIRKGKDRDNLILKSNNKEYDDIDINKSEILRLYKAHGPIRDSHY